MEHGGNRKGAGRKATGKKGKVVNFNCHENNLDKVKQLSSENKLSRTINEFLSSHRLPK